MDKREFDDNELETLDLVMNPIREAATLMTKLTTGMIMYPDEFDLNKLIASTSILAAINNITIDFCRNNKEVPPEFVSYIEDYTKYFNTLISDDMKIRDFAVSVASEVRKITISLLSDNQ